MKYQRAERPESNSGVVSIADLALFALPDSAMRSSEEVRETVSRAWPFEVRSIEEEAGASVAFDFADGSRAIFFAWK